MICGGVDVAPAVVVTRPAVMFVLMVVRQVTSVPPALPVPLHWLTLIGIARLTRDPVPTLQRTVEPPPVADPLHWVTVALVVLAG